MGIFGRQLLWLASAALPLAGCLETTPPSPPLPSSSPVFCAAPTVRGPAGPIAGAHVSIGGKSADTNADGYLYAIVPAGPQTLVVTADGYRDYQGEYEINAWACDMPVTLTPTPTAPRAARLFAAERGALHVCGYLFCDDAGEVWDWRGVSLYRSFGRFLSGEDLRPTIRWLWAHGINVVRVWPQQDGGSNRTSDRPDFETELRAYLDTFADAGIRVELTAITEYGRPFDEDVRTLQRVYDAAAGRWNVFVEAVNEPWNAGAPDPVALVARVDRRGVLSAYGLDPVNSGAAGCTYSESAARCPHLDYVTTHLPRDLAHYYRNSKDLVEMRPLGVPVVDDEPLGIADYDKTGSGARSTETLSHVSHFAICRLYGAGCTVHSQAGLEGRVPNEAESISNGIATAISRVWQAIPGKAAAGVYVRAPGGPAGGGDFALTVTRDDLMDGRGYGSLLGDVQYVVLPQSQAFPLRYGYAPIIRSSWASAEPVGSVGIFRVTR
jgi:hypothetical protein